MYRPGNQSIWKGRQDPGSTRDVWHQVVQTADLNAQIPDGFCFLGFCSDVGVKRNLGRAGAVDGPDAIRKAMVNLAIHFDENTKLTDVGDVVVSGDQLENAQKELARYTTSMIKNDTFSILMGGGHEISYAHGKGVLDTFPNEKVGMINFDPHFDLRAYPQGAHSGSWARQLFDEYENFHYLPIGINEAVNIASMFEFMRKKNQSFISMEELLGESEEDLLARIDYFIDQMDKVCVTLDLDVFSAGVAPGVSAANPYGALPHHIKPLIKKILQSGKVVSFDVAEMSPEYDDGRTAKLAASFVYDVVNRKTNP
ncbi:formiminoglutamase [Ekhidna lutea]|uniref:Formimidoylglutamase n=1 Tax=Ekhidna lutea TaxID=447679 RepID=A0A239KSS6_EKHLU|nr:formimidoylglutamase [Ekhidna lutea]SNT20569.1 formiminoglutamase [Ekhidna lutea]